MNFYHFSFNSWEIVCTIIAKYFNLNKVFNSATRACNNNIGFLHEILLNTLPSRMLNTLPSRMLNTLPSRMLNTLPSRMLHYMTRTPTLLDSSLKQLDLKYNSN